MQKESSVTSYGVGVHLLTTPYISCQSMYETRGMSPDLMNNVVRLERRGMREGEEGRYA